MPRETGDGQDFSDWKFPDSVQKRLRENYDGAREEQKRREESGSSETMRQIQELNERTERLTNRDVANYFSRRSSFPSSGNEVGIIKKFMDENFLDRASEEELTRAQKIVEKDENVPGKITSEREILEAVHNFLGLKKAKFYRPEAPGVLSQAQMAEATERMKKTKVR